MVYTYIYSIVFGLPYRLSVVVVHQAAPGHPGDGVGTVHDSLSSSLIIFALSLASSSPPPPPPVSPPAIPGLLLVPPPLSIQSKIKKLFFFANSLKF